ncbi:S1 RNA-binding domain-containing protein [Candidatus Parcubacteria bacterium]|nr:S1 RNA-binding domain-containing protein [Candidatus Parcubacteria bacterium]
MQIKNLKKIKTEQLAPLKVGEIVEGHIVEKDKSGLYIDLGAKGIGIIFGKEFAQAKISLKSSKIGDKVTAKIVDLETEDGYKELSLASANQEIAWQDLQKLKENEETIEAVVKSANKGGLLMSINSIDGFLPASQLLPEHYPKVDGADPLKITTELQKLIGQKLEVRVFDLNPSENKLILSEKQTKKEKTVSKIISLKEGEEVEGEVSGVTSFGAFLSFNDGLEGLIPSEEMAKEKDLKIGQKLKAKITSIANSRIYLSLNS